MAQFRYRRECVESKTQKIWIKIIKIFQIETDYKQFSYKWFLFHEHFSPLLPTDNF
jgi:hypothetical protein